MSRKPQQQPKATILGPDGKPLDVAAYRPKPAPVKREAAREDTPTRFIEVKFEPFGGGYLSQFMGGLTITSTSLEAQAKAPLRERVTRDLAALHDALPAEDFAPAPAECPPPPPEETDTYRVAFGSAVRRCTHPRSVDTVYARRERQCLDCGRYFTGESDW